MVIDKDTIRVYSLHIESLHISQKNDYLVEEDKEALIRNIAFRFAKQQEQVDIFKAHHEKSPYKTIVCGDFNNTAFSYIYRKIRGNNLNDAFSQLGFGFGSTFDFDYFPLRIDYILLDKSMKIRDFQVFKENLSDHFPIMVNFEL